MEQDLQRNLFGIQVTPNGEASIRKFASVVKIIIALSAAICLLVASVEIIRVWRSYGNEYDAGGLLQFRTRILPFYAIVYIVIFSLDIYFYWKVAHYFTTGINLQDETTFNKAFDFLYRYAIVGVCGLAISLFVNLLDFIIIVKYYHVN